MLEYLVPTSRRQIVGWILCWVLVIRTCSIEGTQNRLTAVLSRCSRGLWRACVLAKLWVNEANFGTHTASILRTQS
jgi:hypothetical protein